MNDYEGNPDPEAVGFRYEGYSSSARYVLDQGPYQAIVHTAWDGGWGYTIWRGNHCVLGRCSGAWTAEKAAQAGASMLAALNASEPE
ncbi:hypothetical protein [Halochromatium glycolicum]|jgi:hypothetical protein|uniref:Uncharacterized protein n=1 Tax=Halochromatium glycolicum TaxID=85075 RepID=A0AAJ0U5L1_9GAMM|nr:hypothetical protein [Halochromatium glycolicum]MBK1705205.1 hypothetical protein [Halochromatium glycolicum]